MGVMLHLWNRLKSKDEMFQMRGTYNSYGSYSMNNAFIGRLSYDIFPKYVTPSVLDGIMLAFIQAFDVEKFTYNCYLNGPEIPEIRNGHTCYRSETSHHVYKLWLKQGMPYPDPDTDFDLKHSHPPPETSEPWHGGTLYTWPQHEPLTFLGLDAS